MLNKGLFLFALLALVITGTVVIVDAANDVITYKITGGQVINIEPNVDEKSLTVFINTTNNGSITLILPSTIIDSKIEYYDMGFLIFVDENDENIITVSDGLFTDAGMDRVETIYFKNGTKEIKLIGTFVTSKPSVTFSSDMPDDVWTKIDPKNRQAEFCIPESQYKINYTMEYGSMVNCGYALDTPSMTIQIASTLDDQLVIDIPKQYVYSFDGLDCKEGQMIILMDGEVIEPEIISSKTVNTVTIPFQGGAHEIEFIGTVPIPVPSPAMYCGIVRGYETQYLPPRWQLQFGVSPELVRCNQGLELAVKASDGESICVMPLTKSKLAERNFTR